ncbi:MAG: hypothetical protein K5840_02260 [Eubacterium sp.]|nr:hypothetical protein [Eubacterium sp.]
MLTGVSVARKKDGTVYYRSGITFRLKHISLGSFPTPEEAHAAYMEAGEILQNPGLTLDDLLTQKHTLSFEKVISLANARDNGVYIKNPIYLRSNYFSYFISDSLELKFDVDDLFYYSFHRIMKRQGRYFVNDYGMQLGILTRFGIPPYSVEGRDYRFVNGDSSDLRYSNVEVINPYHGVTLKKSETKERFKVVLHLRGNWVVGYYDTLTEAAVAYNKAADLATNAGIKQNFPINDIPDIKARQYAEIYSQTEISPKLLAHIDSLREERRRHPI